MKLLSKMTNSAECGHLSDTIGQTGSNFNGVQPESISNSVPYVDMTVYGQDNSCENMWLGIMYRRWFNDVVCVDHCSGDY